MAHPASDTITHINSHAHPDAGHWGNGGGAGGRRSCNGHSECAYARCDDPHARHEDPSADFNSLWSWKTLEGLFHHASARRDKIDATVAFVDRRMLG